LILTALVVFCCSSLAADTSRIPSNPPVIELKSEATIAPVEAAKSVKPDSPTPKISSPLDEESDFAASSSAATLSSEPILSAPIKPAATESFETPRQRKIWYGLIVVSHSAAAFDAWTTRRAVSSGHGVEANPLERPFANSGAIYATTQICPVLMDYLGHKMMRSRNTLMRRMWWLPQTAGAGISFGAGMHNYTMVH
jgi:hypothetical protein